MLSAAGKTVASTMTAGPSGIWRVSNLSNGTYTVVCGREGRGGIRRMHSVPIVVNHDNQASNQSIQWLRKPTAQVVAPADVKKIERSRSD